MAITRTAMTDDDGSGTTGTILNNAWKTELYGQIDGIGTWIDIPHNPANYSGFTIGTYGLNAYTVIGKTLIWIVGFYGCNVPTGITELSMGPGSVPPLVAVNQSGALGHAYSVPSYVGATWFYPGAGNIAFRREDYPTLWAAGVAELAGVLTLRLA